MCVCVCVCVCVRGLVQAELVVLLERGGQRLRGVALDEDARALDVSTVVPGRGLLRPRVLLDAVGRLEVFQCFGLLFQVALEHGNNLVDLELPEARRGRATQT